MKEHEESKLHAAFKELLVPNNSKHFDCTHYRQTRADIQPDSYLLVLHKACSKQSHYQTSPLKQDVSRQPYQKVD